jgi:Domain of unknown function (DUF4397)
LSVNFRCDPKARQRYFAGPLTEACERPTSTPSGEIMRAYRVLLAAFVLAALALSGCNTGNGVTTEASQFSTLRVANFIPDAAGPLNVTVDSNNFVSGLSFPTSTQYQQISMGITTIQVIVAGTVNAILGTTASLLGQTTYSYVMFGTSESPFGLLLNDTVVDPGSGNFSLRVTNAATGSTAVDVYITPPGADLKATSPSFVNVPVSGSSQFVSLPSGNVEVRVTPAGNKTLIFDANPITVTDHTTADLVIYTRASSALVNTSVLNINSNGTSVALTNLLSEFKVINGSQVTSPLNVSVNNVLQLANIPVGGASSYLITNAGSPTLSVEATSTPGASLLTFSPTLVPGADASIVLTGTAGALKPLVLADNNLPPALTRARVRFVNASADLSSVDVFVNFSRQIAGLAMNSAISTEFDADAVAGTAYQFDFAVAGTSVPLLKLPNVLLTGGKAYSIYVVGAAASLTGVVTEDK